MKRMSCLLAAFSFLATASVAHADDLDEARRLLEKQHKIQCVMRDASASTAEKSAANQDFMAVSNELGQLQSKWMTKPDVYMKYQELNNEVMKKPCTSSASGETVTTADIDKAIEELKESVCTANSESDNTKRAMLSLKADKTRKKVKTMSNELRRIGKKADQDRLDKATREIEMGIGC